MPPEPLIALARVRMANRELPSSIPTRIFGGLSGGATCALCVEPIQAKKLEFEADLGAGQARHFHPECYAAWETAVRQP